MSTYIDSSPQINLKVLKVSEDYIKELNNAENKHTTEKEVDAYEKGGFLKAKVERAIEDTKKMKATKDDNKPVDLLKEL